MSLPESAASRSRGPHQVHMKRCGLRVTYGAESQDAFRLAGSGAPTVLLSYPGKITALLGTRFFFVCFFFKRDFNPPFRLVVYNSAHGCILSPKCGLTHVAMSRSLKGRQSLSLSNTDGRSYLELTRSLLSLMWMTVLEFHRQEGIPSNGSLLWPNIPT